MGNARHGAGVHGVQPRSVKICPGTTFCKRAKQDSVHLGMQLERKYLSQEMPSKMKIGVSGCINSCTESRMKDVGVIGSVEGLERLRWQWRCASTHW